MADRSPPFASAAILTNAASEMLRDAAAAVKDAGAIDAEQEIILLAEQVGRAAEKLRQRDQQAPANENEPEA